MSAIQIQIVFHSDWHVGEGAGGAGYIDRIVRRHPQDGLPFVPAKTLTGILRDGCERIACGLDDGQAGAWQAFVATLFGEQSKGTDNPATTTPARLRVGPARLAPELRAALAENGELAAALVFIKPGIAIDPDFAALDQNGDAVPGLYLLAQPLVAGFQPSFSGLGFCHLAANKAVARLMQQ